MTILFFYSTFLQFHWTIGFSTAYIIFIGTNLEQLFLDYLPSYHISSLSFTLMLFPFLILICLLRKFKSLAGVSAIAFFSLLFCVGVTLYNCIHKEMEHHQAKDGQSMFQWNKVNRVDVSTLPIFFGISVYIFEGIGYTLRIFREFLTKLRELDSCWTWKRP